MDRPEDWLAEQRAEQVVALMDSRLRYKLKPEQRVSLAEAIKRSGARGDVLSRRPSSVARPPLWTLSGLLARVWLLWSRHVRREIIVDENAQLAQWALAIQRSGLRGLLLAVMIGLFFGVTSLGLIFESSLQILRDDLRPRNASGNIVIVRIDEDSEKAIGPTPWSRRYSAVLLDRLREMGARVIVFDGYYDLPGDRKGDAAFADALARADGGVWLSGQSEFDPFTGRYIESVPQSRFGMSCCIATNRFVKTSYWTTVEMPLSDTIAGRERPSSPAILAGRPDLRGMLRLDTAISFRSIPTISAISVINGTVASEAVRGKSIIVESASDVDFHTIGFVHEYDIPVVYARALAAETILNSQLLPLGWHMPLLMAFLFGLLCVVRTSKRARRGALLAGIVVITAAVLIGDRSGYHFEIFPSLLALTLFGLRDQGQRRRLALDQFGIYDFMYHRAISAQLVDPGSGLPSLAAFVLIREKESSVVAALKVERYRTHCDNLDQIAHREFARSIAARINILFPDQFIHQGEDGLFVWLIPADHAFRPSAIIAQLTALFRIAIPAGTKHHDVGIAVGFGSDLSEPFAARLAVAIDRARVSQYGRLTSVG